jgi:hypothetical protein
VTGMVPLQKRVGKKLDGGIRTVEESHCAEDGVADIAALRHYENGELAKSRLRVWRWRWLLPYWVYPRACISL